MRCVVCPAEATTGALCASCVSELESQPPLCLEQVQMVSRATADGADAALVDQWGRVLPLAPSVLVGRQLDGPGLSILEASVSRHHARIERSGDEWEVRDLGSSNGTFIDGGPVDRPSSIPHQARVRFGSATFYFVEDAVVGEAVGVPASARTFRPGDEGPSQPSAGGGNGDEHPGLNARAVRLLEPSGGGGGLVDVDGTQVQLTASQFELVQLLVDRMRDDADSPAPVRGFVRTSELLASISWDTRHPSDNHLKQLVRRTRRSLEGAGVDGLIESRHGFGYRLSVLPSP